jgi:hypothetical protein
VATEQREFRPVPDPTVLTTQQLLREVDRLQILIDRLPGIVRDEVANIQALHDEKFASITLQFAERDKRTEQLSIADKTAIAAALQAQKEAAGAQNEANAAAIAKSEAGFTKQIDQITTLISAGAKASDDKIDDIKDRLSGLNLTNWSAIGGYIVGAVGILAALSVVLRVH